MVKNNRKVGNNMNYAVVEVNKRYFYFVIGNYKVRAVRSSGEIREITGPKGSVHSIPMELYNEIQLYGRHIAETIIRPA